MSRAARAFGDEMKLSLGNIRLTFEQMKVVTSACERAKMPRGKWCIRALLNMAEYEAEVGQEIEHRTEDRKREWKAFQEREQGKMKEVSSAVEETQAKAFKEAGVEAANGKADLSAREGSDIRDATSNADIDRHPLIGVEESRLGGCLEVTSPEVGVVGAAGHQDATLCDTEVRNHNERGEEHLPEIMNCNACESPCVILGGQRHCNTCGRNWPL
jgi:hypothetical protein